MTLRVEIEIAMERVGEEGKESCSSSSTKQAGNDKFQ